MTVATNWALLPDNNKNSNNENINHDGESTLMGQLRAAYISDLSLTQALPFILHYSFVTNVEFKKVLRAAPILSIAPIQWIFLPEFAGIPFSDFDADRRSFSGYWFQPDRRPSFGYCFDPDHRPSFGYCFDPDRQRETRIREAD
ncbi:hypothetical protein BGX24_005294 [Mortierella sp. AD032]|nr:hypothetical protein BGX24_005294 [Mortierella sp. AD032]